MKRLANWYSWVNILSIDVAIGAAIGAAFFLKISSLYIRPVSLIVLSLAVWIIYTVDHLKDVYYLKKSASTKRHSFHQQNFRTLSMAVAIASSITGALIFQMSAPILNWGIYLSIMVLVYIIVNRHLKFLKELIGALLYCAGVFLPSLSQLESISDFLFTPVTLLFSLLVLSNLYLFSWYELDQDKEDNHQSFTVSFGKSFTKSIIISLLATSSFLVVLVWNNSLYIIDICVTLMTVGLVLITLFPNYFKQHDRYRYLGDLIFIFPLLALFV